MQVDEFARAYEEMRANPDVQFQQIEPPETPRPPDWLARFFNWLGEALAPAGNFLVDNWPVIQWVLLIGGAALLLYLLARLFGPDLMKRKTIKPEAEEWVPDTEAALALLEDAERLAAEGRFDEATHLLLRRSVGQIAEARPELVEPSSTAREIASATALPEKARTAFAVIAGRVERSLFALTSLSREDWQAARDAYAEFALAEKSLANAQVAR